MLTPQDVNNCTNLLQHLSPSDIYSLCETVTNRLVAPTSYEEAIDAIVRYTRSPQELLGRKKVKTDVLFQYLLHVNVDDISPKSTKTELVSKVLDFWKMSATPVTTHTTQHSGAHVQVFHTEINNYTMIQKQNNDGEKIAIEFMSWFYKMLNSLHDSYPGLWGPEHFWPNSKLTFIAMTDSSEMLQEEFDGANAVNEKISSLVLQEKITLNPNTTSEGYKGVISPHGLAKVAVCGTLHKCGTDQELVGVFEQCFGLLRDVNDGNRWKIKECQLRIRVAGKYWQPSKISLSEDTIKALEN